MYSDNDGYRSFVLFTTDNECTYNDPQAIEYMGKKQTNEKNVTCIMWKYQRAYPASRFPDGSVLSVENFCRNPHPNNSKAWCFLSRDDMTKWGFCTIRQCGKCCMAHIVSGNTS